MSEITRVPFSKDYSENYKQEWIDKRIKFLNEQCHTDLKHINNFSGDPQQMIGNIENPIGIVQIPLAISGPLRVNGEYAKGDFYVPLATTEGVLSLGINKGMKILTKSGGVTTKVLKDVIHVSPKFITTDLKHYSFLEEWVKEHFQEIKNEAEKTTKHGKLLSIVPKYASDGLILTFHYDTGDAMGMNLIVKATYVACTYIAGNTKIGFFTKSNFSSEKKASAFNFVNGFGKELFAEAIIPRNIFDEEKLKTTPEEFILNYNNGCTGSVAAGMIGGNAHIANPIAAIFLACGQDVAHVANCCNGITGFNILPSGDLRCTLYIPGLPVGTVGGGTSLPTQKECLSILNCYGNGKARKFAEIVAASALAAELSMTIALTNSSFVHAHESLGRNKT